MNTCYGCPTTLAEDKLRLCDSCRQEHIKTEAPYLVGYIDWECKFLLSKNGIGHKFPYQETITGIKWVWFRILRKLNGVWKEV